MQKKSIFDLFEIAARKVNAEDDLRILRRQMQEMLNTCGSCALWMTRQCPREEHNNRTGKRHGPSYNGIKCVSFVIDPTYLAIEQNYKDKIEALEQLLMEI